MFTRLSTRFIVAFAWFSLTIASANELAPTPETGRLITTTTDNPSSNVTLVSLSKSDFHFETPSTDAPRLPESLVSSIREVYVWAWPLVYMSNLKQSMQFIRAAGHSGGAPVAPVNSLCMLTDVVSPEFQSVPCPNRDVVYGFGIMDLAEQPVIIQIPDFGNRFWLYQIGDHRMESIGKIGSMYGTRPGYIMVVGPAWQGIAPDFVQDVIRSRTNLAYILPRVLAHDQTVATDTASLQDVLRGITIYPLGKYTGVFKQKNWKQTRWYPAIGRTTRERNKLVRPEHFFDDLARVLSEINATPAEQPLADLAQQLIAWQQANDSNRALLQNVALQIESETIAPMFELTHGTTPNLNDDWISIHNGAAFGDDYWTRTAIAKSNPFVNRQEEAKYYYLERHGNEHLQGGQSYTVHFPADQLPPADAFWSVTLYNADHQFHPNAAGRYAIGNLDKPHLNADGSLTITVQPNPPTDTDNTNWLPSPSEGTFKLYLRLYAPKASALNGDWTPPPIKHQVDTAIAIRT